MLLIVRDPQTRARAIEAIANLDYSKPKQVDIREYKSKRSNPQNDAFHGICADAAQYIGCSTEEAKRMIKADLLGTMIVEKEGFKFEVLRSTADLNVQEMSQLIEQATAWCIERDIPLRQFAWEYS